MNVSDPGRASCDSNSTAAELAPAMSFNFLPDRSLDACAEFRISTRSLPFLLDHAFQDLVVLPGSLFVEMALSVHHGISKHVPRIVRHVTFRNPVILSPEDTIIRVEVRKTDDAMAEYTFYEATADNVSAPIARQRVAKLEIDCSQQDLRESVGESFSIEAFQKQAHEVIDSEHFYKTLRGNGNQYGPRFQCISSIWHEGSEYLGRLSWRRVESEAHCLDPTLLDSTTQILATFVMDRRRTFVLQSIERIDIQNLNLPDTLWCHARLMPEAERGSNQVIGDIRVFGPSGSTYLKLSGVRLTLLDSPEAVESNKALTFVVASNFTAEPLEDSLKFWASHFGLQANVKFAPYDQIFQQLLQTESAFRNNRDGVNIILFQLEKWGAAKGDTNPAFDRKRAEQCFGNRKRCTLPNGLEIVHLKQYETDYLYQEIFEHECYLKHGISLPDGATVVDIGANIGLFSLFVMGHCRKPRIYAFEPAPVAYDILRANCDVYGSNTQAFNLGVSDKQGTATFTFYENSSVFSGFYSDEAEDREAIEAVVRSMLDAESVGDESKQEYVDELTQDRLRRSTHLCRLTTVSDIIRDNRIDRIDLLKIDAEKSELDIIRGIEDCDWAKIDQIVIEIHDPTENAVRRIQDLLRGKGYRCAVEQEKLLERSGLFNLFAIRDQTDGQRHLDSKPHAAGATTGQIPSRHAELQRNVQDFYVALQSFTTQISAPLALCCCPASPAVEADAELKAAVADAEQKLLSLVGTLTGVSTISSEALLRRYPVTEYYDTHSHQLGDIPYTPEGYAAVGTALFRTIFNLKRKPFKVVVLDCDNTLWKGVCGEDGWRGVAVTEPYRTLQRFMIGQMNLGMLLCLCSKNSEQDVLDVFDHRDDMLLKREHLVSWRINWNSKSENIKSLAAELNLALESFIFVDDNPLDCGDVEINCPDVLTLRLPQDTASFATFLDHIWGFDHTETTVEDRGRVKMYQDNARRERFRAQASSLSDFVAGLMVCVDIDDVAEEQLSRVSQLTFRTNQFNFTTIRRSPSEIRDFLKRENTGCLAVRVTDRFGDYGLVGVVLYETEADRFKLDTFLLSCRVLGRGVEHKLMSNIGQRALSAGKKFVEVTCHPTDRNLPAREFVSSLGNQYQGKEGELWLFPADYLARLRYDPEDKTRQASDEPETPHVEKTPLPSASGFGIAVRSEDLQKIGEELYDISRVTEAIDNLRLRTQGLGGVAEAEPSGQVETIVLNVWRKVLGRPGVGLNVNFFEVGGNSLKAVQVIAMIRKELKQNLSITSLFECPTVRLLAAKLSASAGGPSGEAGTAGAALRGQQRRSKAMGRTRVQ